MASPKKKSCLLLFLCLIYMVAHPFYGILYLFAFLMRLNGLSSMESTTVNMECMTTCVRGFWFCLPTIFPHTLHLSDFIDSLTSAYVFISWAWSLWSFLMISNALVYWVAKKISSNFFFFFMLKDLIVASWHHLGAQI